MRNIATTVIFSATGVSFYLLYRIVSQTRDVDDLSDWFLVALIGCLIASPYLHLFRQLSEIVASKAIMYIVALSTLGILLLYIALVTGYTGGFIMLFAPLFQHVVIWAIGPLPPNQPRSSDSGP